MKKLRLKTFFIACCTVITFNIASQNTSENVVSINMNHINAIKDGEKVKGYYMFYKVDKIKGGDFAYNINILDENAEITAKKTVVAGKNLRLLQAAYNNNLLCFKLYDTDKNLMLLKYYDKDATEFSEDSYIPDSFEAQSIRTVLDMNLLESYKTLYSIKNSGFLNYSTIQQSPLDMGYNITYYPDSRTEEVWEYGTDNMSKETEFATILEANKEVIVLNIAVKKSIMSKSSKSNILVLNTKTGEEIFSLTGEKFDEVVINSDYDINNKQLILIGKYFKKGDDQSLGLVIKKYDQLGNELEANYYPWEEEASKFLGINNKKEFKDLSKISFKDIIKMPGGKLYFIGESNSESPGSDLDAKEGSFYIFEFDKNKALIHIEVIKKSTDRAYPKTAQRKSGQSKVNLLGYDYEYTKKLNNKETFAIFYRYLGKEKGGKRKAILGFITNTDDQYMNDKIEIPTEADLIKVLPASEGNILLIEYFKKERRVKKTFKKFNF